MEQYSECMIAKTSGQLNSSKDACGCKDGEIIATCVAPDGDSGTWFTCAGATSDPVQYIPADQRSGRTRVRTSHSN